MAENRLKKNSPYAGSSIMLTTKHCKGRAISPAFKNKLGAQVVEYAADTDLLGTFSGEIERKGNALECARSKCEWAFRSLGADVKYALASEGSFGPHPFIPFISCDFEILYFIDKKLDFHLQLSCFSEKTNYQMQEIQTFQELKNFAIRAQFPSHALILRPDRKKTAALIFKGITTESMLREAFDRSSELSVDGKILVETDMRAHLNPSRMIIISALAEKLAERLSTHCPQCSTPGWGQVRAEKGLECRWCGLETDLVKSLIFGCTKCHYEQTVAPSHNLDNAEPGNCSYCNP